MMEFLEDYNEYNIKNNRITTIAFLNLKGYSYKIYEALSPDCKYWLYLYYNDMNYTFLVNSDKKNQIGLTSIDIIDEVSIKLLIILYNKMSKMKKLKKILNNG